MKFSVEYLIRFQHCDPAGIVFYPRYYELFCQVVEDWFEQALDWGFGKLSREQRGGIPLVHTSCDFLKPSRLGDRMSFDLGVAHIGTSSFSVDIVGRLGDEIRVKVRLVMAYVSTGADMRKQAIPDALRAAMERYRA